MSKIYIVATPIGNLGDISERALKMLEECDVILAEDTRHSIRLLNYFNIKNKLEAYHKFNEKYKAEQIIERIKNENLTVCIISDAGTPCISDPGYEVVKAAHENGIEVIAIPGPSAIISALSISGFELADFAFYGFLDRDNKINDKLEEIRKSNVKTSVIYESPKRIVKLVQKISEILPNSYICICSDITKLHERTIYGSVAEVLEKIKNDENIEKGEYALVLENREAPDENNEESLSIEALLVDEIVKEGCTMKEAIKKVVEKHRLQKNDVYESSLKLKNLI